MLAQADFAEGVERQRIVVERHAADPNMQRGTEVAVHDEFFVTRRFPVELDNLGMQA